MTGRSLLLFFAQPGDHDHVEHVDHDEHGGEDDDDDHDGGLLQNHLQ